MQNQVAKQIIQMPVSGLVPYARNSRTHSDEQIKQIAESIREFGFTNPVLIDDTGGIIAGHGRVMAARVLGMSSVPTINVGWLSEKQRRAYVIADNQLALNAGWDHETLREELGALADIGFDLDLLGFDDATLDELCGNAEETGMPGLPSGDKSPFQQVTFTLHDGQAEEVQRALKAAKDLGPVVDSENENSNGNALARICEIFLLHHANR